MATTYTRSQYKTWVRTRLGDDAFSDSLLNLFLNDANREICHEERWPFLITTFEGTVTVGVASYDWQSDAEDLINLTLTDPDNYSRTLHYLPFETFDKRYPDPSQMTSAQPTVWTKLGRTFTIGPAYPDQVYTLLQRYLKAPTLVDSDSATIDVPDEWSETVVLSMLRRAYKAQDQFDLAQEILINDYQPMIDRMRSRLLLPPSGELVSMNWGRNSSIAADLYGLYD